MKRMLSIASTLLWTFSFTAQRVSAQGDSGIGRPSERIWFDWWWLLPLLALTFVFLLPNEGGGEPPDDTTQRTIGTKGGRTTSREEEGEDDLENGDADEQEE